MNKHRQHVNMSTKESESTPQISDTPFVTGTGSLYWNVRDIVFGPNRSNQDEASEQPRSAEQAGQD